MVYDGRRRKLARCIAEKGALSLEKSRTSRPDLSSASFPVLLASFLLLAALLFSGGLVSDCLAQGIFGKNKIQYSELKWSQVEGEHVTLYFYSEEEQVAAMALPMAESTCVMLSDTLGHRLSKKIPLVIFSSNRDFQQSNIIPYLLPEAVGGLTEFVKGRVLVPYTGSFHRFKWVLRHELTHAFMLDKIETSLKRTKRVTSYFPPLWFSEGLAEYMSAGRNAQAETVLRDAVLSEQVAGIEEMWKIENGVLVYREGQSLIEYISRTFGFSSIVKMLENWGGERTFESQLEKATGVSVRDLGRNWMLTLKEKYYPDVATREWPSSFAESIVSRFRFNLSPVWTTLDKDRGAVVYLGAESETPELRMKVLDAPGRDRLLVRGGTSRQYESLHLFRSRLGAGSKGTVVFSAQREEADVVHVFDLSRRKRLDTIEIPGVVSLSSPSFSPDGTKIVLSGQDASGRSDIFVVSLAGPSVNRLTLDFFDDRDPDWSPDGKWIVFSSDRASSEEEGTYGLFLISPESGAAASEDPAAGNIVQLTPGTFNATEPRWSPAGDYIAFVSDREGVPDLFLLDFRTGKSASVTKSLAGILTPSWGKDDNSIYFSGLRSGKYEVFRLGISVDTLNWESSLEAKAGGGLPSEYLPPVLVGSNLELKSAKPYRRKFGLDIVRGTTGYDPEFAQSGAGEIALSDILGNEHLLFYLSSQSEYGGSFFGSLSGGVTYLNLARRLSYGVGAFSFGTVYDEELEILREERRTGFFLLASYPLSRFERIDATLVGRLARNYLYRSGETAKVFLLSNYFSYVWDNSSFDPNAEIVGTRANLTLGLTRDITRGKADYLSGLADLRENVALSHRVIFAWRGVLRSTFGKEGSRYYMGGPWSLRGYASRSMSGKTLLLINNEVRLPVLARVVFGFPGGRFPLPSIKGALFVDVGASGEERSLDTWKGSLGVGLYMGGGYLPVVRLNNVWRTDFKGIDDRTVLEFFVGWNF